jgi:hypothetical protein
VSADRAVDRLAARQHGVFALRQALAVGMTRKMVRTRLASGRWGRTPHPWVYRVAGHPATWESRAAAAVLSGPEATVVSHLTAAALLGLTSPPDPPHITIPPGASGRRSRVAVHRSPITAVDRGLLRGVPGTRPARTLVDCAETLDAPGLMAIVDPCLCRQLTTPREVRAAADRVSPGGHRRGLGELTEVLSVWTEGIKPGSAAEMRLLRRIERWGFPPPECQVELHDESGGLVARIDLAWPWCRSGLEYDGQEYHGPRQWEADELRHARVEALGWRLARVEKVDLLDGASRLAAVIASLLARAA